MSCFVILQETHHYTGSEKSVGANKNKTCFSEYNEMLLHQTHQSLNKRLFLMAEKNINWQNGYCQLAIHLYNVHVGFFIKQCDTFKNTTHILFLQLYFMYKATKQQVATCTCNDCRSASDVYFRQKSFVRKQHDHKIFKT